VHTSAPQPKENSALVREPVFTSQATRGVEGPKVRCDCKGHCTTSVSFVPAASTRRASSTRTPSFLYAQQKYSRGILPTQQRREPSFILPRIAAFYHPFLFSTSQQARQGHLLVYCRQPPWAPSPLSAKTRLTLHTQTESTAQHLPPQPSLA